MFTVDPSSILTMLVKGGNVFIPKSSQKDVRVLQECLHCEKAEMNVVEKTMILYNFTIGLKGKPAALRVGMTYVCWESYTRPTIYMEVDDVELLVEFYNVLLTKSNWQELKNRGFPPEVSVASSDKKENEKIETTSSIKIGSIDLSGTATVRIVSKALNEDLGLFELDMDSFDDFTDMMREQSESNFKKTGRRGLASEELATMLEAYFTKKIQAFLKHRVGALALGSEGTKRSVNEAFQNAGQSLVRYVAAVGKKKRDDLEQAVKAKLDEYGVTQNDFGRVLQRLQQINATAFREAFTHLQQ